MPQATATPNKNADSPKTIDRVTVQLDKPTGDKLDSLARRVGAEAGSALGITINITRADMVRSLVNAKHDEYEAAEQERNGTPAA